MNANPNMAGGILAAGLLCAGFILLIGVVISACFCMSLQRTMSAVAPRNRQMPPGLVWLHMLHLLANGIGIIPVAGQYIGPVVAALVGGWDVFMVLKIAESVRREYKSRKLSTRGKDFGKKIGLTWACMLIGVPLLNLVAVVGLEAAGVDQDLLMIMGMVFLLALIVQLVLFIIYWVQVHGHGTQLLEGRRRRSSEEEDYDDDYQPRRRRSRPRDDDEDEDEDETPRSRRRRDEDDEEEAPRSRRQRNEDDDEDEEDRPRRRRRRDEDDDD